MNIVQDYFLRHYSYISKARTKRPQDFASVKEHEVHPTTCVFCPGNEAQTPTEIGRIPDSKGGWLLRWFPNKFPAVASTTDQAYGYQEVVVETPDPAKQLWDFRSEEFITLLGVYQDRTRARLDDARITSVTVFKNHGKESGASLLHSHTQILASEKPLTSLTRMQEYETKHNVCAYCMVLTQEQASPRVVFENEAFSALCPKAPRYAMEVWIVAKEHGRSFVEFSSKEQERFANLLLLILKRLKTISAPYCFSIAFQRNYPQNHFHLELLPRLHLWGGFELASGDYIIGIPPEDAAQFYRTS